MDLQQNLSRSKEVLGAYLRQGAHEIGAALYGPGTIAQHPEYGMLGTKPPSMVVDGLKGEPGMEPARDDLGPSGLEAHLETGKSREEPSHEHERNAPEPERE